MIKKVGTDLTQLHIMIRPVVARSESYHVFNLAMSKSKSCCCKYVACFGTDIFIIAWNIDNRPNITYA